MKKQSPYLESWLLSFAILVFFNTEVAASKEINIEKLLSNMEIADNYSKRKKGLMYRDNIDKDFGIYFHSFKHCFYQRRRGNLRHL